jgi:hypothetical protein
MTDTDNFCLIEGRFAVKSFRDRIEIFDSLRPHLGSDGTPVPTGIVGKKISQTHRNACLAVLGWLRDNRYITTLEYLHRAEIFLERSVSHPQHRDQTPENDCLV